MRRRVAGTAVLALLAAAVVLLLTGAHKRRGPGVTLFVEMAHAGPLTAGADVRAAGTKIGAIEAILPRQDGVVLRAHVDAKWAWLLHDRAELFIHLPDLLGRAFVEVGLPKHGVRGEPLADGAVVRGVDAPRMDRMLGRLDAALRMLNEAIAPLAPEARELAAAIAALRERRLQLTSFGELPALLLRIPDFVVPDFPTFDLDQAAELAAGVERLIAAGAELAAAIEKGEGTLQALARDADLVDDVKALTKTLKREPWRLLP